MTDRHILTETYLSLRRLENEVIRERYHGQTMTESQCVAELFKLYQELTK